MSSPRTAFKQIWTAWIYIWIFAFVIPYAWYESMVWCYHWIIQFMWDHNLINSTEGAEKSVFFTMFLLLTPFVLFYIYWCAFYMDTTITKLYNKSKKSVDFTQNNKLK